MRAASTGLHGSCGPSISHLASSIPARLFCPPSQCLQRKRHIAVAPTALFRHHSRSPADTTLQLVQFQEPARQQPSTRTAVIFIFGLLAVGISLAVKRWRDNRSYKADLEYERRRWGREQALEVGYAKNPLEANEFNLALARTRQAMHVSKAVQMMRTGAPSRAVVELQRALQENSAARCPVLSAQFDKEDMNRLYQLHLQNTELPAKYSTLLQLREMLAIKEVDADALEEEVLGSGSSFSI